MRSRILAFVVVLAAVLLQPVPLDAYRWGLDPTQPVYAGYLQEDASCPGATHVLIDPCGSRRLHYLVFNRMKGVKKYVERAPTTLVQGPIDTTTCSLPLIDVRWIRVGPPPPPCAP